TTNAPVRQSTTKPTRSPDTRAMYVSRVGSVIETRDASTVRPSVTQGSDVPMSCAAQSASSLELSRSNVSDRVIGEEALDANGSCVLSGMMRAGAAGLVVERGMMRAGAPRPSCQNWHARHHAHFGQGCSHANFGMVAAKRLLSSFRPPFTRRRLSTVAGSRERHT